MARPKNTIRPTKLNLSLPEDLRHRLDEHLKNIGGGVIKVGAYRKFIIEAIRKYLGDYNE